MTVTQGFAECMLKWYLKNILESSKNDQVLFSKCLKKPCIKHAACDVMRQARTMAKYDYGMRKQVRTILKTLLATQGVTHGQD
jgi:hypothetical protein